MGLHSDFQLDDHRKIAFMRILKAVSSKSARLLFYVFAIGTILVIPPNDLPSALTALATGIGVNALSSILERIAYGDEISDEEIKTILNKALEESKFNDLIENNQEIQHELSRLSSWQKHLKFIIESGNYQVAEMIAFQYKTFSAEITLLQQKVSELATKEQSSEMQERLGKILEILQANVNETSLVINSYYPGDVPSKIKLNPFIAGPALGKEFKLYGRRSQLLSIINRVGAVSGQSISIVGERRIGKSSLLLYIANHSKDIFNSGHRYEVIYLDLSSSSCNSCSEFLCAVRMEMNKRGLPTWGEKKDHKLSSMSYALSQLQDLTNNIRIVLCMDEFEVVNENPEEFDKLLIALRSEAQLGRLILLTASRISLADLCAQGRKKISPFYNIFTEVVLGLLDESEWQALIKDGFSSVGIGLSEKDILFVRYCAGGHPFFTQLAGSILFEAKMREKEPDYGYLEKTFLKQALPFYRTLLSHQNSKQREVLKGNKENLMVMEEMRLRGLLDEAYDPFSQTFNTFLTYYD